MKKTLATIGTALTLTTGGVVGADRVIDPYVDMGTHEVLDIKHEIKQGERVEISKEKAEISLKGWNDEYNIKIIPQIPTNPSTVLGSSRKDFNVQADRKLLSKKIEYKNGEVTAFIEPRNDTEFDIDFTLDEKPDTNVFEYVVEGAEDFDFFYQPELTQEEIDNGAERPENVVGSYAVYHKQKVNHKVGGTNYGAGKVMHIYRPKAIDAKGNEVWAELNYENGILSVTVPQDFLDSATYPVVVDPTFGYTSQGASDLQISSSGGDNAGAQLGSSIDGLLVDLNAYVRRNSSNANVQLEIWSDTGTVPDTRLDGSADIAVTSSSYSLKTSSLYEGLSGNYWAVVEGIYGGAGTQTYVAYDSGGGTSAFKNDVGVWSAGTDRHSIYATYNPSSVTPSNYGQCKTITVNNSQVSGSSNLNGFPILIDLADADLASSADANGGDIVFTDESGEILPFEIERYSNGVLTAWASSTLDFDDDTIIKMYYSTTTVTGSLANPTGVWGSDYQAVYHLGDGDSTDADFYQDSTSNNNDGTLTDGTGGTVQAVGQIGNALDFSGGIDVASIDIDTITLGGEFTVSMWWNNDENDAVRMVVGTDAAGSGTTQKLGTNTTGSGVFFTRVVSSATSEVSLPTQDNWHYITWTRDSSNKVDLYINNGTANRLFSDAAQSGNFVPSRLAAGGTSAQPFNGTLDEIRFSSTARSADWITTEFNNQSATSTFYTVSSEFDNTCAEAIVGDINHQNIIWFD